MLSAIHYALEYSDPSILDEVHHAATNLNTDGVGEKGEALKRERLAFAKTYVELILRLSREPLAANPPQLNSCLVCWHGVKRHSRPRLFLSGLSCAKVHK